MLFPAILLLLISQQLALVTNEGLVADESECINNSDGQKCSGHQQVNLSRDHIYQMDSSELVDDAQSLTLRLSQIDILNQSLEFILNFSSHSGSWYSRDKAEPTLRQVLVLHRHGDRTPIHFDARDPLAKEPFWTFHGLGQLTNRGKSRLHLLGRMYRNRYHKFMGKSVNKNQRISKSSGSLRCIESAQMFLSSFLALNVRDATDSARLQWSREKDNQLAGLWQPASIITVPVELDGMLAEGSKCKALDEEYANVINKSDEVKLINHQFEYESKVLNEELGYDLDLFYKWMWASSQIEVERSYFAEKVSPRILEIYDRVQLAGHMAMEAYQSTLKSKRLRAGLLINDMISNMKTFRQLDGQKSQEAKKFVHYAAHDLTLVVVLGMLDNMDSSSVRPDYASNLAIELHQDQGEWFLKFYYMAKVPSEPLELHLARCEKEHPKKLCTLDKFSELMSVYALGDWLTWFNECQNDFKSLNPYAPSR